MIGFAVSQLIWGPISEKYGRKLPLIYSLALTNLGVVFAMLASNVWLFNTGRFIESIGLGCAPVLGRAIIMDKLSHRALSSTMTYGTISTNIMPALAPIIGGYILVYLGWRSIFAFLLVCGIFLLWLLAYKFEETHQNIQQNIKVINTFKDYLEIFTHKQFLGYLLPYVIVSGAMIAYYTVTPFIFISTLHISANNYGFLSLMTVGTYILGAIVSNLISERLGIIRMVIIGNGFALCAAILFISLAICTNLSVLTVIIPISVYTFAAGIISPNCNTGAMDAMRHNAGASAAVIGFGLYLFSFLFSTIITTIQITSLWPLAVFIAVVSLLSLISFCSLVIFTKKSHIELLQIFTFKKSPDYIA